MKLLDMIRNIKIVEIHHEHMSIKINEQEYHLKKDYTRQKRDGIRIPLEELNIEYAYILPFELNIFRKLLWITKELEYAIIWDYVSDELLILDIQELKEQDESYLLLRYGKVLLEKIRGQS